MKVQCPACGAQLRLPALSPVRYRCPGCGIESMPTHYEILEITVEADQNIVKAAYKRLVFEYHPDRNFSGELRMKFVVVAYQILSNPVERALYDEERARERAEKRQEYRAAQDRMANEEAARQSQQRGQEQTPQPTMPPLTLDHATLVRLRELHKSELPGNRVVGVLLPVFIVLMTVVSFVSCCCLPSLSTPRQGEKQGNHLDRDGAATMVLTVWGCVVIGWGAGIPGIFFLRTLLNKEYEERNRVILNYELNGQQRARYDGLLRSLASLWRARGVWQVTEISAANPKYNVGVKTSWKRGSIHYATLPPKYVRCNVSVFSIQAGSSQYYFFPDCVLVCNPSSGLYTVPHTKILYTIGGVQFRETAELPDDAKVLGHAWLYTNVDGGPDRRFQFNRQIPICDYGTVLLKIGDCELLLLNSSRELLHEFEVGIHRWCSGH